MMMRAVTHLSRAQNLIKKLQASMISHKLYYGQGGQLSLSLSRRKYDITVETFWQDYAQLSIQGLTGVEDFTVIENGGKSEFSDGDLVTCMEEEIKVHLQVPQDFTIKGSLNGSLRHKSNAVGNSMRSNPFKLQVEGRGSDLELGSVKVQNCQVFNKGGRIKVDSLTLEQGSIIGNAVQSPKIMVSKTLKIQANKVKMRSLIMFAKSRSQIKCKNIDVESISGHSSIQAQQVLIKRYFGGQGDINIKCLSIKDKLGIQTGTGKIQFSNQQNAIQSIDKIKLGSMHKGSVRRQGRVILIL